MVLDKNILDTLGCPKYILAPMVDASELAWRMLARRYSVQLTYTPMIHSRLFCEDPTYRQTSMQFCKLDRPLVVQFCANDPEVFVKAGKMVEQHCDAIDLNLGCPQGIAKRGYYGSFIQDNWELISSIVSYASSQLSLPVTCKCRVFKDVERTVGYAKMLEKAGASLLVIHGRTREAKGQLTGLADWNQIKRVKEAVKIPVIANGNIQYLTDVERCISFTHCDAVMSAGRQPPVDEMCFEYLDCASLYPCPLPIVRGHIFKLCRHLLDAHSDYRSLIGACQSIDELRCQLTKLSNVCQQKCGRSLASSVADLQILPYPHWICQPYERGRTLAAAVLSMTQQIKSNSSTNPQQAGPIIMLPAPDAIGGGGARISYPDPSLDEMQRRLREIQAERLKRKQSKRLLKQQTLERRYSGPAICQLCHKQKPSNNCLHTACRNCCTNKDPERLLQCPAHKYERRRRTAHVMKRNTTADKQDAEK